MTFHSSKSCSKCIAGQTDTHSTRQINSNQRVGQALLNMSAQGRHQLQIGLKAEAQSNNVQHTDILESSFTHTHKKEICLPVMSKKKKKRKRDCRNIPCITALWSAILESSPGFYCQCLGLGLVLSSGSSPRNPTYGQALARALFKKEVFNTEKQYSK